MNSSSLFPFSFITGDPYGCQQVVATVSSHHHRHPNDFTMSIYTSLIVALVSALALYKMTAVFFRRKRLTTALSGPPNPSILFGMMKTLRRSENPVMLFSEWAKTYGNAYKLPSVLYTERIVVCDSRALMHVLAQDSVGYTSNNLTKRIVERLVGLFF